MMRQVRRWSIAAALISGLFLTPTAFSNVSLKNGNFFIGYTDLLYPGGFEPKIERVYNSKTGFKGIFGHGWGTEYEVYLTVAADGSVVVHEYGGGAENRFLPRKFKKASVKKAVGKIAAAAKKAGLLPNAKAIKKYKSKLSRDAVFRNDEWKKFIRLGKLKPTPIKTGTKLFSSRFSYQKITKVKKGFRRDFDNGRTELFDNAGRLIKITDKNSNWIALSYGKDGRLKQLVDNFTRKIFFSFNNKGLLEKIEGANRQRASYKYNGKNELVQSRDVDGNTYKYTYSSDGRHNMTQISYKDGTTMQIAYHPKSKNENVKSIKDRDGTKTTYKYKDKKKGGMHFVASVEVKDKGGRKISESSYEYIIKLKKNGERYTYRMVANVDGDKTVTTYNECCGYPLSIKRNGRVTKFQYNKKGNVTKKDTPTEVVRLKYDKKAGKVARVDRYSKVSKRKRWSRFKYDGKGNLKSALNSRKQSVFLFYDPYGRIARMKDQNGRQIKFKYNENSKPIEITDPKLGTITVSYTNTGEVKKVESTAGRKIALQVTSAFQNLLDIIRPAGVTLSF